MRFWKLCVASAAILAIGLSLTACSKSTRDPSDKVSVALKEANLRDVDVNYDRDERVVHLKGTVGTAGERAQAEEIADRAVGTSGKVLNKVTVKGVDETTTDDNDGRIKDRLKEMVDNDPQLKNRDIGFTVNNGAVEIRGSVASPVEKSKVAEMVRSVDGVRDVANDLEIKTPRR